MSDPKYITFGRIRDLEEAKKRKVNEQEAPPPGSAPLPDSAPLSIAPPRSSGPLLESAPPQRAAAARSAPLPRRSEHSHSGGALPSSAPPLGDAVDIESEYFKVPHSVIPVLGTLGHAAQLVYVQLIALSYGWKRTVCKISYPRLGERTNLSVNGVKKGVVELERRGLVDRLGEDSTSPNARDRGFYYEVKLPEGTPLRRGGPLPKGAPPPRSAPPQSAPMKENKEKGKEGGKSEGVFELRTIAARLFEVHRNDPTFDHARLRELVTDVLVAQGSTVDDELLDEAIRGMAT